MRHDYLSANKIKKYFPKYFHFRLRSKGKEEEEEEEEKKEIIN